MGVTNIRCGNNLLERAAIDRDQIAFIPACVDKSIYLETRSISDEELETYVPFLSMPRSKLEKWVAVKDRAPENFEWESVLPQAIPIPKVVLSLGLGRSWRQE